MIKLRSTLELDNTFLVLNIEILKDRALMLKEARSFFFTHHILEVDVPALNPYPPIDTHIEVMQLTENKGYLHTSPEYGMKRLLCSDIGSIYQISHVFRKNEIGKLHNPEFTMVEWYVLNIEYTQFIKHVIQFIELFLGKLEIEYLTFQKAFLKHSNIHFETASLDSLKNALEEKNIYFDPTWEKKILLDLILTHLVEPNLGKGSLTILYDYPKEQAALAKTYVNDGKVVAKRFEIYYKGIELANGYDELAPVDEYRSRLENEKVNYLQKFNQDLPLDEYFLKQMQSGLPSCCGVAVGFDRLLMIRHHLSSIHEVLPFSYL